MSGDTDDRDKLNRKPSADPQGGSAGGILRPKSAAGSGAGGIRMPGAGQRPSASAQAEFRFIDFLGEQQLKNIEQSGQSHYEKIANLAETAFGALSDEQAHRFTSLLLEQLEVWEGAATAQGRWKQEFPRYAHWREGLAQVAASSTPAIALNRAAYLARHRRLFEIVTRLVGEHVHARSPVLRIGHDRAIRSSASVLEFSTDEVNAVLEAHYQSLARTLPGFIDHRASELEADLKDLELWSQSLERGEPLCAVLLKRTNAEARALSGGAIAAAASEWLSRMQRLDIDSNGRVSALRALNRFLGWAFDWLEAIATDARPAERLQALLDAEQLASAKRRRDKDSALLDLEERARQVEEGSRDPAQVLLNLPLDALRDRSFSLRVLQEKAQVEFTRFESFEHSVFDRVRSRNPRYFSPWVELLERARRGQITHVELRQFLDQQSRNRAEDELRDRVRGDLATGDPTWESFQLTVAFASKRALDEHAVTQMYLEAAPGMRLPKPPHAKVRVLRPTIAGAFVGIAIAAGVTALVSGAFGRRSLTALVSARLPPERAEDLGLAREMCVDPAQIDGEEDRLDREFNATLASMSADGVEQPLRTSWQACLRAPSGSAQ